MHHRCAATLKWNFITPIARELMLLLGFVDADASTLRRVLSAPGRAVMLAIGGSEEALLARPGFNDLVLNKRSAPRCGPHRRSNWAFLQSILPMQCFDFGRLI